MRKLTLSLIACAATVAFGGVAHAQQAPAPQQPDMTRAAAAQRADQIFDRLDANHDGKLDQADREARQKLRFDRIDTNHDGSVSFAEFTAARPGIDQAGKDRGGDRGGRDGHRWAGRGFGHGFAGRRGGMVRMADADKDGAVSKAEFETAMLQRFDSMDANHDGTITPDEAKAARDNMRQQWQSRRQDRNG